MVYIDFIGLSVAALLGVLGGYLYLKKNVKESPRIFWPDVQDLKIAPSLKARLSPFVKGVAALSFLCFLIGLADPYKLSPLATEGENQVFSPEKGIAIYFVLDQSGSMAEPASKLLEGDLGSISKIALLKDVLKNILTGKSIFGDKGLANDLVGLVAFARAPTVISPLTLNHKLVVDKLAGLDVVKDKNWDGTSIGYAIYKTAHLIVATKQFYKKSGVDLKNAVIILATDGLQDPNPLDRGNKYRAMELEPAAEYAKENGIRLYIINIEPKLKEEKYAPNLRQLHRITELTGGKFYIADGSKKVGTLYEEINKIEKSRLPISQEKEVAKKVHLYPYFVSLGMLFAALYFLLKTTLFRQKP